MTLTVKARRSLLLSLLVCASLAASLEAQTIDDGIMMAKHDLFVGNVYVHDSWDQYWEGSLERVNGNIGTVTTQTNLWFANYGITDRLNVLTTVPYVWTNASQGVLHGMRGFQDITFAVKYSVVEHPVTQTGSFRALVLASGGIPLTNYSPDFQPLSIGSASRRMSGRLTLSYLSNPGLYFNASSAYTWRSTVTLDRPYYYTDGTLTLSDQVPMPSVFDYVVSAGYMRGGLMATASFSQ